MNEPPTPSLISTYEMGKRVSKITKNARPKGRADPVLVALSPVFRSERDKSASKQDLTGTVSH
jgi:hypothetical protein